MTGVQTCALPISTEKTIRPIVGNKPFIVYGPRNFLNNLKLHEGFQTFETVWDESYDNFEGTARWCAIKELINYLLELSSTQWQELIHKTESITQHNRAVLKKIIDDRKKL